MYHFLFVWLNGFAFLLNCVLRTAGIVLDLLLFHVVEVKLLLYNVLMRSEVSVIHLALESDRLLNSLASWLLMLCSLLVKNIKILRS